MTEDRTQKTKEVLRRSQEKRLWMAEMSPEGHPQKPDCGMVFLKCQENISTIVHPERLLKVREK